MSGLRKILSVTKMDRLVNLSEWVHVSILSGYVKKNIEKWVSMIIMWNWGTLATMHVWSGLKINGL